ncbi:polysaccharide pyruvyl transferase family protein [Cohnella algarum]|uniref:polysaccharide pyruvyl transferase family protein n=1 Tax=Cohnella algarum TaxID=2044859 RepID=UPI001966D1D8|nr:polysaccharide pyruvyl transferase family protein [Cohnella algarum]MBN2980611.1 polysaccharide pyruvyl transferase family protein [Cohnella algarum]
MTRVALLTECRSFNPLDSIDEKLKSVGGNTGNIAYISALREIFNATQIHYTELNSALLEDKFDTYIVGNLSWIIEDKPIDPYFYNCFRKIIEKGKKFIPISVGTQTAKYKKDFKYHPTTLTWLKEINEQAIIACRGEYTANVLSSNGVKNIEVIGCPSLFHKLDSDFKIYKKDQINKNAKIASGITPWPNRNMELQKVKDFFEFIMKNQFEFIEQTNALWVEHITKADSNFNDKLQVYLKEYSKMFFNIGEWRSYCNTLDFSFGGRFHGNVIPLLEGVPSLFITIDARTREMCEYFKFPFIDIGEFDFNLTAQELYDMADYSDFNKHYKSLYLKFEQFAEKNGLKIAGGY